MSLRLALRLLRLGGRSAWTSAGLVAAGVAVATALLCVALGALHGLDARETRTAWRDPVPAAPGEAVTQLRTRTDAVAGRPVTEVNLIAPRAGAAPPPGLPRMPSPGEVWMSPSLTALAAALPPGDLAARYPGPVTGVLGPDALRDPDELVAVVGRPAGDPVLTAPGTSTVVAVAAFDGPAAPGGDSAVRSEIYRQLTVVAAALVLFPAAGLVGASARLSAARRGQRLATLRLLGASTPRITVVAVTEVGVAACAGALAGIALEWVAAPALAAIPLAGGGWFAADVRPPPSTLLAVAVAVTLLATVSAVGGLRRVVISPLGVARRRDPQVVRGLRLLGPVAAVVVFGVANVYRQASPIAVAGPVFAVGVLALLGAVGVLGPLVVRVVGAAMTRRARSPHRLLAGRRLLDDPKGAFRPLAGLTLAVFVAGFLAPLTSAVAGAQDGRTDVVTMPGGRGDTVLVGDLGRGALVVLVATFLLAATATATTSAARVLDHRHVLYLQRLAGTPTAVLDRARRAETLAPLLANGTIALALGLLCASPFAPADAALQPGGPAVFGALLVVGTLTVLGATAAARPLLASVTEPGRERDR
ncbi:FtsX-like permease family protein [Pseudonocardia sp. KRD291]|uniref:FtsX-like permease family protein n=1 Tax=Pseudonocardia sp. KRD291 TaxID=2792007 RepID=UPI001C4A2D23|nr:FtsX-like permease family protein [Pseudonocardia sp. KRD291]MBW0106479.1 ABC transporter permease [Pseudonocardia sp. KRD291]